MKNMELLNKVSKTIVLVVLFFFGSYSIVTPYSYAKASGRMEKAHNEIEKIFKKINEKHPDMDIKLTENSDGIIKMEVEDISSTVTKDNIRVENSDGSKEDIKFDEEKKIIEQNKNNPVKGIRLALKSFFEKMGHREKNRETNKEEEESASILEKVMNLIIPSAYAKYEYNKYEDSPEVKRLETMKRIVWVLSIIVGFILFWVLGSIILPALAVTPIVALLLSLILPSIFDGLTFGALLKVLDKEIERKDSKAEEGKDKTDKNGTPVPKEEA